MGLFRVLVGAFVMAPERELCEAAVVLLIVLISVGVVLASSGASRARAPTWSYGNRQFHAARWHIAPKQPKTLLSSRISKSC